ncbi:MAG: aminotransferase class V-fold PLP-dependent enzyme, partial [Balneolaceae bacterium]
MKQSITYPKSNTIEHYRQNFPHINEGIIFLNHASVSPLSLDVKFAIFDFLEQRNCTKIENLEEGIEIIQNCRRLVAKLINSESEEQIVFTRNTSDGITLVAEGLPLKPGDEILLNNLEFPSNVHPWRALERKGIKLKIM